MKFNVILLRNLIVSIHLSVSCASMFCYNMNCTEMNFVVVAWCYTGNLPVYIVVNIVFLLLCYCVTLLKEYSVILTTSAYDMNPKMYQKKKKKKKENSFSKNSVDSNFTFPSYA